VSICWQPKGTVTATLGSVMYVAIVTQLDKNNPLYNDYLDYAILTLITSILTILISLPIASVAI